MIKVIRVFIGLCQRPKQAMLFLLLISIGPMAFAACRVNTNNPQVITLNVGNVLVTPGSKIGDVLATGTYDVRYDGRLFCPGGGTMFGRILRGSLSASHDKVWTTNIPGIGVRLYRKTGTQGKMYYPHETHRTGDTYLESGQFVVEIIKIAGSTGTGSLSSGRYSSFYGNGTGPSKPILVSRVLNNGITIVGSSCSVSADSRNKVINMNKVSLAEFKGVGSTAAEHLFFINIHCVGDAKAGGLGKGLVNVRFDYASDTANTPGVLRALPDAHAASGVSVQLLDGKDSTPIKNGASVYAGNIIDNQKNTITVPLKVRYFQTADEIKGGAIKSIATFTLEYN